MTFPELKRKLVCKHPDPAKLLPSEGSIPIKVESRAKGKKARRFLEKLPHFYFRLQVVLTILASF